jgi:hypothetical protein
MTVSPGVGALIGERYQLTAPALDRGLGETWRALDTKRTGAFVSLKWLRPIEGDVLPPPLRTAINALTLLRHDAVPTTLQHGLHAGRPWVVFDEVHGESMGTLLDAARADARLLDLALVRNVFDAASAALDAAHAAPLPVLHAALTPGSLVVSPKPVRGMHALVLDLGLAPWLAPARDAPARSARVLATQAPELASGAPTVATDVFALAAVLTEMLALPADAGATLVAVTEARRRSDVPRAVWDVLATAMSTSPSQRHRDVGALRAALGSAWRETAPAASSRLASLLGDAPAGGAGSLLETVAPSGPSLTPTPAGARELAAMRSLAPLPVSGPLPPTRAPVPAGRRPGLAQLIEQTSAIEAPDADATAVLPPETAQGGAENPWSTAVLQRVHTQPEASMDAAATVVEIDRVVASAPLSLPTSHAPQRTLGSLVDALPAPLMNEPSGTLVAARPVSKPTQPMPPPAPPVAVREAPRSRLVIALGVVAGVLVIAAVAVVLTRS